MPSYPWLVKFETFRLFEISDEAKNEGIENFCIFKHLQDNNEISFQCDDVDSFCLHKSNENSRGKSIISLIWMSWQFKIK